MFGTVGVENGYIKLVPNRAKKSVPIFLLENKIDGY